MDRPFSSVRILEGIFPESEHIFSHVDHQTVEPLLFRHHFVECIVEFRIPSKNLIDPVPLQRPHAGSVRSLFPTLIVTTGVMLTVFLHAYVQGVITIMLSAAAIVRERERGTIEQLIITPIRSWELILPKTLPFAVKEIEGIGVGTIIEK
jgi:hypothetical protein